MSDPADINDRLEAAADKAEGASEIMRRFSNDPAGTYISTESGPIPSLAEWLEINEDSLGGVPGLLQFDEDLQDDSDPAKGAGLVGYKGRTVAQWLGDITSVKDFGAVGGGVTNDGPAIQAAIDSLPGGGLIYVPAGFYRCEDSLVIHSGLTFVGESCVNRIFGLPTGNETASHIFIDSDTAALFTHALGVQVESVSFTDISFAARLAPSVTPRGTATGFAFTGSYPNDIKHMTFNRCQFANFGGYAIRVYDPTAPSANPDWNVCPVTMNDCTFYYNTVGISFEADNADYWELNGCAFFGNTYGIVCSRSGILVLNQCFGGGGTMLITGGAGTNIRDSITFIGCQFEAGTAMLHVADNMATQQTYRPIKFISCVIESPVILAVPCHFISEGCRYVDNIEVTSTGVVIDSYSDSFLPSTAINLIAGSSVRNFINHGSDLPIGVRGQIIDGKCIRTASAPPVSGSYFVGDITYNSTVAVGTPIGWVCTASGAPGTWSIIDYVQGPGATVTQLTSKATPVTVNAMNGQIICNASSVGAGVTVAFNVSNSFVTNKDSVALTMRAGASDTSYEIRHSVSNGVFVIYIKNISGGALAEAISFNFSVHKSTF